jgi:hypothetical protein
MNLTGRQEAFLNKFMELYRQAQKPLHYTDVARVAGVAKITAYEMLRVLEERGLVRSQYVLRGKGKGPGRSTVVTLPTAEAFEIVPEPNGVNWDRAEWEQVKAQILESLKRGGDYQNLLDEILTNLSERTTPLVYSARMVTAIILNLLLVGGEESAVALVEHLKALGLPDEGGLNALTGLTLGLSYVERANRSITERLIGANRTYQQALGRLGGEGKRHLTSFVQEVMKAVAA